MGWEWHDRRRNQDGQFMSREHTDQIHIRLRHDQAEQIRHAARASHMEISAYCMAAIEGRMAADGQQAHT